MKTKQKRVKLVYKILFNHLFSADVICMGAEVCFKKDFSETILELHADILMIKLGRNEMNYLILNC